MGDPEERERFRRLLGPVPLDAMVETVDAAAGPAPDVSDERERFLREAGA